MLGDWFSKSKTVNDNALLQMDNSRLPIHVAVIMDGNGRWAKSKGLPRTYGHKAGAETLRKIVTAAGEIGVKHLTAYAFSTENWKRPTEEVSFLMHLLSDYLDNEIEYLLSKNVKLSFIGECAALDIGLQKKIETAHRRTAECTGLRVNLAVNYGGRGEILRAATEMAKEICLGQLELEDVTEEKFSELLYTVSQPDPDLLIRTSGDRRISNFLLWQCAYSELWFTDTLWPDFTAEELYSAIIDYQKRDRRFGGISNKK